MIKEQSVKFIAVLSGPEVGALHKASSAVETMLSTTALTPERALVHIPEMFIPCVEFIVANGALDKFSNVRLIFPKSSSSDRDTVVLSGPKQEVDAAADTLEQISESIVSETIAIPTGFNINARNLQDQYNVMVTKSQDSVLLIGLSDDVAAAVAYIDDNVAKSYDRRTGIRTSDKRSGQASFSTYKPTEQPSFSSNEPKQSSKPANRKASNNRVDIPSNKYEVLVAQAQDIETKFSVTLDMPRAKKPTMFVVVKGDQQHVTDAMVFIRQLVRTEV